MRCAYLSGRPFGRRFVENIISINFVFGKGQKLSYANLNLDLNMLLLWGDLHHPIFIP